MKKTHIILLVLFAITIAVLISYMGNLSTTETIASARQREGAFVHLAVKVDKNQPIEYDPIKDPNYLAFTALDSLGSSVRVVYRNSRPTDFEKSERIVLSGRMRNGQFECKDMMLKCPSKYKDDPNVAKKNLSNNSDSY